MSDRRIRILPEHLANKIAAGEVIQRPESVVKELLENSLDAGAKSLLVVVKEGGKQLIQVSDDGVGMDEEDARTAFLRHATSKIATADDLEAIRTFGFRGEALASIAAVAQVTMKTRRREDDVATVVRAEGGGELQVTREAREPGTTLTVQHLFSHVPARRKFLKSTQTEFRHLADAVQRIALSHPDVALRFVSDDQTVLDLKPAPLEQRLREVFGERQFEAMVWTGEQGEAVSVHGYVGKPQFGQKTRANQFLFLNNRFILNRAINHAVFSAYENMLVKGAFPFFVLYLEIDPHRVDVNVHPSKLEAKFEDEQSIYRFVAALVRRTLSTNDLVPALSTATSSLSLEEIGLRFTNRQHSWRETRDVIDPSTGEIIRGEGRRPVTSGADLASELLRPPARQGEEQEEISAAPVPSEHPAYEGLLWQVHRKYIILQIEQGVMIIDQHVAHERVLYEQALRRFESGMPVTQQLLFPRTMPLTPGDYALVQELQSHLEQLGFSVKLFSKNTVVIDGVPPDLKSGSEMQVLQEVLDVYRENLDHGVIDARDNVAKSYSCKAAVKAGDPLTEPEMRLLIGQLFSTTMPYVCPHGRPIVLKIAIDELDRRFGRK